MTEPHVPQQQSPFERFQAQMADPDFRRCEREFQADGFAAQQADMALEDCEWVSVYPDDYDAAEWAR